MEWTPEDILDVDMNSELDRVVGSRPKLDFDINELPQLELDDDRFITDPNGWLSPQLLFHTYRSRSDRIFDIDQSNCETNSTLVDPFSVIPPPPGNKVNVEYHPKVPELAHHYKEEPSSESEDESYLRDFEFMIPSNDDEMKLPVETKKYEDLVEKESHQCDDMGYPKPPYSYACLIAMALKNSQSGALPVSRIYSFICAHFPYFRTAPNGWKNSIRHNLSLNKSFDKFDPPTDKKRGGLWTMNPLKAAKFDLELQKWSQEDPFAIKRAMTSPYLLELLERGEVKFNDDPSEGSGGELATNSATDSYDESIHEDDVEVREGFYGENRIFEDHDYSRVNLTVRARYVYQPVQETKLMDFSASEMFCEIE